MVVEAEIFPVVLQSLKGTVHIIPDHEILHLHWDISSDDCVYMCIDCPPVMKKKLFRAHNGKVKIIASDENC